MPGEAETVTAEKRFQKARDYDTQIEMMIEKSAEVRASLTRCVSNYDYGKITGSNDPHRLDQIAVIQDNLDRLLVESASYKKYLLDWIYSEPELSRGERCVLISYYINGLSLEAAAERTAYSRKQAFNLRKSALEKLDQFS